jgi:hypothetical protein
MALRFEEWLNNQQQRNDLIGNLARLPDLQNEIFKSSRHKSDEHKNWADIVISIAEPGQIVVFNEAWQEFLLAKQADTDSQA